MKKILVLAEIERNDPVPDEGKRKFAFHLAKELNGLCRVLEIRNAKRNILDRLMLNPQLLRSIGDFNPNVVFFLPTNVSSLIRYRLKVFSLRVFFSHVPIVLFSLQPIRTYRLFDRVVRLLLPNLVFVQSEREKEIFERVKCKAEIIPSGVDLCKFHPANASVKRKIRKKFGVGLDQFVVLHVGHISAMRNVHIFGEIAKMPGVTSVVVVPPSSRRDISLSKTLQADGVEIVCNYLESIQEVYQLSDCYVFPAEHRASAIGFPLSILEAMACNLPVITTRFEALPYFLSPGDGIYFADTTEQIIESLRTMKRDIKVSTRNIAKNFSWKEVAELILQRTFQKVHKIECMANKKDRCGIWVR